MKESCYQKGKGQLITESFQKKDVLGNIYDTVTLTMLYLKFLNNNDSVEFCGIKQNSSVIF